MNNYLPEKGTPVNELDTPCIIIDLDIAEKNIAIFIFIIFYTSPSYHGSISRCYIYQSICRQTK